MHAQTTDLSSLSSPAALEFECQVETLVAGGVPWTAGLTDEQFRALLAPLAERAAALPWDDAHRAERPLTRIPFALVVAPELLPAGRAARLIERRGRSAVVTMLSDDDLDAFAPIEQVEPPPGAAYLLVDVDTGAATRNDPPDRALPIIAAQGRSPLTLEEGIALVAHHPEAVATNAGFSLLGSRRGDRRVTAMWISRGSPKLGWCFAGVPHTWLGSASCAARIGL